jgi:hypothetical protein
MVNATVTVVLKVLRPINRDSHRWLRSPFEQSSGCLLAGHCILRSLVWRLSSLFEHARQRAPTLSAEVQRSTNGRDFVSAVRETR